MNYIALRAMRVHELNDDGSPKQGPDGRPVLREVKPGEPCPEAASWKNLHREVLAGRIGIQGMPLAGASVVKATAAAAATQPKEPGDVAEPSEGEAAEARRKRVKRNGD